MSDVDGFDVRATALDMAIRTGVQPGDVTPTEQVLKRAEKYLAFLEGETSRRR